MSEKKEKLCGVKKTKYIDAYLKYELLDMLYKKMQKGMFKDITKTQARNMTISDLCKLLKIKVTEKINNDDDNKEEERICTPRRVKEYPNAYSKTELAKMALEKRLASSSESKKLNIKSLCKILKIRYVDVPVKNPKKKRDTPIISSDSEDSEDESKESDENQSILSSDIKSHIKNSKELKCISDSKLKLKNHQKIVVNFLNKDDNKGLLVLHPVGTGKTLTAATVSQCFLKKNPKSKVIIVTPTSLQGNFKKALVSDYGVDNLDRYEFYTIQAFTIASKKGKIKCNDKLLILDEAHNIRTKIINTKKRQGGVNAIELLKCASDSKKVLLLSATPSINKPNDMINLFAMIDGKVNPISGFEFYKINQNPKSLIKYLKCKVSIYSPSKEEVLSSFPLKNEEEIFIKMNKSYYSKYIEVLDNKIGEQHRYDLFGGSKDLIPFYNGVRRAANNLEEKNSPKVNWIMKQILENRNSKFLIFSHFLEAGIELLSKRLKDEDIKFECINGSMNKNKRDSAVFNYNKGKNKILLISKAGGEGLDLKETNFVIIMEPTWNEAASEQVIGRAVRMGSHSNLPKDKRIVNIYRLYMIQPKENVYLDDILDNHMLKSPHEDILSVDIYLRNLAFHKQQKINSFLQKLEKVSIEKIECDKKLDLNDPYFDIFFDKKVKSKSLRNISDSDEESENESILSSDESDSESIISSDEESDDESIISSDESDDKSIISSDESDDESIISSDESDMIYKKTDQDEYDEKSIGTQISKISDIIKSKLKVTKYKLTKFLGKGVNSTVFEGIDDKGNKVAIKYMISSIASEEIALNKLRELYMKLDKNIWIIKYCGRTLLEVLNNPKFSKLKNNKKKVFQLGLEAIHRFYKKTGYIHSDIKLDNICVKEDSNGKVMFDLMDYSNISVADKKNMINDASIYLKAKYKKKNIGKSFYQLFKDNISLDQYLPPIYGNAFWSFRASFEKYNFHMTLADDIESLILSLWNYYDNDYPLLKMYKKATNLKHRRDIVKEILEFRLNPENCPIPIFKEALLEIRKNYSITVPDLCKKLNLDCDL